MTKQYHIYTVAKTVTRYRVEAENLEKAKEQFDNGNYIGWDNNISHDYLIDSEEEIIDVITEEEMTKRGY